MKKESGANKMYFTQAKMIEQGNRRKPIRLKEKDLDEWKGPTNQVTEKL